MEVPKGLAKCNPAIPPRRRTVNVSEHAAQKGTGKTSSTGRLGGSLIRSIKDQKSCAADRPKAQRQMPRSPVRMRPGVRVLTNELGPSSGALKESIRSFDTSLGINIGVDPVRVAASPGTEAHVHFVTDFANFRPRRRMPAHTSLFRGVCSLSIPS